MSAARAMFLASLLAAAAATSNGDLASWYATRTLVDQLSEMQPEVVAKLLSQVEQKWEEMAVADLRNKTEQGASLASMKESCGKVTQAIVKGSDGDKDRVATYLEDVCQRASGENRPMCLSFSSVLSTHLSHDVYSNREEWDAGEFCADFFNGAVKSQVKKQAADLDAADLDAVEKAKAEKAKAEAEAKAKAEQETATARALESWHASQSDANRLAAEAAKELDQANHFTSQAKQGMAQADKRADAINKESKDAKDTADQARKELDLAAEKEAQSAENEAAEAQEKVNALRLKKEVAAQKEAQAVEKKAVEAKRSAEEKAKAEAQNIVDAAKKAEAEKTTKAALLTNTAKVKATAKKTLRAGK